MCTRIHRQLALAVALALSLTAARAQLHLTDITVFSADSSGSWHGPDVWDTRPQADFEIWIQNGASGGAFLNGPTDASVRPNIALGSGQNSFRLLADPGADYASFGINLFFNGSSTPSISAFGPMLTSATGPHSFVADAGPGTAAPVPGSLVGAPFPGAGTLSFVSGNQLITLTDFYWATPSVYNLDLVGTFSTGADGIKDYVGGITLSITEIPEPGWAAWGLALAGAAALAWLRHRPASYTAAT